MENMKSRGEISLDDARFSAGRPITVVLPAKTDLGIDRTLELVRDILDRAGCPGCFSGFDIRLRHERVLVLDAAEQKLVGDIGLPG